MTYRFLLLFWIQMVRWMDGWIYAAERVFRSNAKEFDEHE